MVRSLAMFVCVGTKSRMVTTNFSRLNTQSSTSASSSTAPWTREAARVSSRHGHGAGHTTHTHLPRAHHLRAELREPCGQSPAPARSC